MRITVLSIDAEPSDNLVIIEENIEDNTQTFDLKDFLDCITLEDMIRFQLDNEDEYIEA